MKYLVKLVRHQHFNNPVPLSGFILSYLFLSAFTNATLKGPLVYFGIIPLEVVNHVPHINFFTVIAQLSFYFYTLILPFQIKVKKVVLCYTSLGFPLLQLPYLLPLYSMHFLGTYISVGIL